MTPSNGKNSVLATYLDENQEDLKMHGFVNDRALWTYYGPVDDRLPEVVLTATTISNGVVKTGYKLGADVFVENLEVGYLDYRYRQLMDVSENERSPLF